MLCRWLLIGRNWISESPEVKLGVPQFIKEKPSFRGGKKPRCKIICTKQWVGGKTRKNYGDIIQEQPGHEPKTM